MTNRAKQDQTAPKEQSDLGLLCLHNSISSSPLADKSQNCLTYSTNNSSSITKATIHPLQELTFSSQYSWLCFCQLFYTI